MKLSVRIGYHKPFLPTPRCKKYRYEKMEEMVELELPEATESEVSHALNLYRRQYSLPRNGEPENPWDVIRTRIFRRTVDCTTSFYREATGKDVYTGIAYDETINPFSGLVFRLKKDDRFVLYNQTDNREFLINQAKEYLDSFLLVDGVLYKKVMAPMWRVHVHELTQFYPDSKSSVSMYVDFEPSKNIPAPWVHDKEFPWYAKDEALEYANQEAKRVGAEKVKYSELERVKPIMAACQQHPAT